MAADRARIRLESLDDLLEARWEGNPKDHDIPAILESLDRFGFVAPPIRDETTGSVIAGHGRIEALAAWRADRDEPPRRVIVRGAQWMVPTIVGLSFEDATEAEAYLLTDNQLTSLGGWVDSDLLLSLSRLGETPKGLAGTGFDPELLASLQARHKLQSSRASLAERFLVPPFSVLDTRRGYWQDRKRAWLGLGIRGDLGRGDHLAYKGQDSLTEVMADSDGSRQRARQHGGGLTLPSASGRDPGYYRQKQQIEKRIGRELTTEEFQRDWYVNTVPGNSLSATGTSVFDPVLCELVYTWFSPPAGRVLDPFAGGSVRGIVAAVLRRPYVGLDLSHEQVGANRLQVDEIVDPERGDVAPVYHVADARELLDVAGSKKKADDYDLIFTCPPYWDLEVYGDDDRDLSRSSDYEAFRSALAQIIADAGTLLRDDRFAVIVLGEVRDRAAPDGRYVGLIPDVIHAAAAAGLVYYNHATLVTPIASTAVRAPRQFEKARKLGKVHQDVVVFVKGDPVAATEACGAVEVESVPGEWTVEHA